MLSRNIGYPPSFNNYSQYTVTPGQHLQTVVGFQVTSFHLNTVQAFTQPANRGAWSMFADIVNAYYDPTTNSLHIPAGILQDPCASCASPPLFVSLRSRRWWQFRCWRRCCCCHCCCYLCSSRLCGVRGSPFDCGVLRTVFNASADPALNYGGIGVVIGHENSHGFDNQVGRSRWMLLCVHVPRLSSLSLSPVAWRLQGSQYDGTGKLVDWWTPTTRAQFNDRLTCMVCTPLIHL